MVGRDHSTGLRISVCGIPDEKELNKAIPTDCNGLKSDIDLRGQSI
jgi:hypothetical protein